jgi:hypothetical protein
MGAPARVVLHEVVTEVGASQLAGPAPVSGVVFQNVAESRVRIFPKRAPGSIPNLIISGQLLAC